MRAAYMLVFQNGHETRSDAEIYRTEVLPELRSWSTQLASRVA